MSTTVCPARTCAASGSARRSNATTAAPDFLARFRHMGSPITPRPMNPSVVANLCSSQPVERGRIVVSQLAAHLRRQVPHLPLNRFSGVGPDAVGVGIVRRPQQMALAEERNERDRHVVFLEGRVDLPLEELARLRFEGAAALVGPELLRLPESPVAVVELLDEPGEPTPAGPGPLPTQSRGGRREAPGAEGAEG